MKGREDDVKRGREGDREREGERERGREGEKERRQRMTARVKGDAETRRQRPASALDRDRVKPS